LQPDAINNNKVVAWYQGNGEIGYRALGNRSLLFNAFNPKAKEIVNKVKNREYFRPFGASVLKEDAHKYFKNANRQSFYALYF
jgi:carbamoyltransferase